MPWERNLEYLETSNEKKKEEKENITPTTKKNNIDNPKLIENKNIFYECINDLLKGYKALLEMQVLGEDMTDAFALLDERKAHLITLGKNKFNLSEEEIENINNMFPNLNNTTKSK